MKPSAPDLAIIIVSYNVKDELRRCLDGVEKTTEPDRVDILVVDNASGDGSAAMIRSDFPRARLIENSRNTGFSAAVNQGIRGTQTRYLLLLNPDTQPQHEAINTLLAFMESHPRCASAGGQLLNTDGAPQLSVLSFHTPRSFWAESLFLRRGAGETAFPPEPCEVDAVVGACFMMRREALDDVGFLDEAFFMYAEEVDWCLRARKRGWRIFLVPQARIVHGLRKSSGNRPETAFAQIYRSHHIYMKKHFTPWERRIAVVGLFTGVVLRVILWTLIDLWQRMTGRSAGHTAEKKAISRTLLSWYIRGCPSRTEDAVPSD